MLAEPGEEIEVAVTATDQLGRPVEAALSLALVNGALLSAYPDGVMPIVNYFHTKIDLQTVSHLNKGGEYRQCHTSLPPSDRYPYQRRSQNIFQNQFQSFLILLGEPFQHPLFLSIDWLIYYRCL